MNTRLKLRLERLDTLEVLEWALYSYPQGEKIMSAIECALSLYDVQGWHLEIVDTTYNHKLKEISSEEVAV